MSLLNQVRIFAIGGMLAAATLTGAVGHIAASTGEHTTQQSCKQAGYLWIDGQGCADESCYSGGYWYTPGATRIVYDEDGEVQSMYMCDGFTGKWESIGRTLPTNPQAPHPKGNAPLPPSPPGPLAPLPPGNAVTR